MHGISGAALCQGVERGIDHQLAVFAVKTDEALVAAAEVFVYDALPGNNIDKVMVGISFVVDALNLLYCQA